MLSFRISQAMNTEKLPFSAAWSKIFVSEPVKMGNRSASEMGIFLYITRSTHLRPRDYIRYIQECATDTLSEKEKLITANTVKRVDKAFSNYLKDEIVDEVYAVIPEIDDILSIISQIRKQEFTQQEFSEAYSSFVKRGVIQDRGVEYILTTLFDFGVIGNVPSMKSKSFFKYDNKEGRFNFKENIKVHRGLFKALQIL